jgi:colanic acid biosynthesis protein WcaH
MENNSIETSISLLDQKIGDPHLGLPEEVFLFTSRITPMVNVDMLIRNSNNEVLLTWRDDNSYTAGWHIPGGIVRYKESMFERLKKIGKIELDADFTFSSKPSIVNEIIRSPERKNRGHFISFLFKGELRSQLNGNKKYLDNGKPKDGMWKWHKVCPSNILPVHLMYKEVINGQPPEPKCNSDFGFSQLILDNQ